MINYSSTISTLKGVGPRILEKLACLNIFTIQDLLFHLPHRYEDRTHITSMRAVRAGQMVLIEGDVISSEISYQGRRRLFVRITDGKGVMTICFFHFTPYMQRFLNVGNRLRCYGEARFDYMGLEMAHPEFRVVDAKNPLPLDDRLTPVYPTTEGLSQTVLRKLTKQAIDMIEKDPEAVCELLPDALLKQHHFPQLKEALIYLHQPSEYADLNLLFTGKHPCQQRLVFEELLAHHVSLLKLRQQSKQHSAPSIVCKQKIAQPFIQSLPFQLTLAQQRVIQEIQHDLSKTHPMLRLVQGDVGSGKTVVAAIAALQVINNQYQVAVMAPTEILAEQHLKSFQQWLEPLNLTIAWLSGSQKNKQRQSELEKIKSGKANIIIGTHALFQEGVEFHDLALVIIDEQHRFGVHQRLALREKGSKNGCYPHQLIMTATPIPRTLAMSAYADLDHSMIDELPPGRTPVKTIMVDNRRRQEVISHIKNACLRKQQVYWVCALIEESDVLQCKAAEDAAKQLKKLLPHLTIELVHGRMKSKEKDQVMSDFKSGKYDVLVATTVIEVGIDVPNASLMIIENAERFGLSQLHQLRGRVGRGSAESFCVLLYQQPLSKTARERLAIMRETTDGFKIAEKDLQLRGPGEVLGAKQSGLIQMKIADLIRDSYLLPAVQQAASQIQNDHILSLIDRWICDSLTECLES